MSKAINALDLFSGCGGLSLGMQQCGVKIIGAIEKDKWAAETYAANHTDVNILNTGVEELGDNEIKRLFSGVTMIAGGPPQWHSRAPYEVTKWREPLSWR